MGNMKNYSIETNVRIHAIAVIAIVSVVISILLYYPSRLLANLLAATCPLLDELAWTGFFGTLEPMSVFWLLWALFNSFLWKLPPLRCWHNIPNLNGTWEGSYLSSFRNESNEAIGGSATFIINQTFSSMSIFARFPPSSESYGEIIGLADCDRKNKKCTLQFSYENQAVDESVILDKKRDNRHMGFNILRVSEGTATGDYFTLRNEMTKGHIELTRI